MVIILKIIEILNDYYIEFKSCFRKIKRKCRKLIRFIRYTWKNPKSKIGKKYIPKINKIYKNINNNLFDLKYRKRNLTILVILLLISFSLLFLKPSSAFYQNNYHFRLLAGKVGNLNASKFDYSLLVYVEERNKEGKGTGNYNLTSSIPNFGYILNRYSCANGSILEFNEKTLTTKVTLNKKDICSIYFDLIGESDIGIQIMIEEHVSSNIYKVSNKIPSFGYKFSHYECENNSTLIYDSNLHKVNIQSNNKDYCQLYFKKEKTDIKIRLYVKDNIEDEEYSEVLTIPNNKKYILNKEKTICTNDKNERIETDINYTDGYIEASTTGISYCQVYLDFDNE